MASILVVDDSVSESKLIRKVLEDAGHSVSTAASGEEALTVVAKSRPELIILDVVMPGKSGFEVCRAIKKSRETADIPVILLTSKSRDSDRFWGMRQGASEYLTKPVEPAQLLGTVKKFVR
jgi:CheY-like chemotaxis protein